MIELNCVMNVLISNFLKRLEKMTMIDETIEYDNFGRMKYHPEYHFSHGKRFSKEELMYLCRFWEFDNRKDVALALGKTEHTDRKSVV